MRTIQSYEEDTTSSEELVRRYRASYEEEDSEDSLAPVHYRGGQVEFEIGARYARSDDPLDRATGADVLSQLGWKEKTFVDESVDLLLELMGDADERVVIAACWALGHRGSERGIPYLLPFVTHSNPAVRRAVAHGLSGHDDPDAIAGLITLVNDEDPEVRNWAVFDLGVLLDVDTPEIRDAIVPVLDDPDAEIRGEALIGLAKRRDPRVKPALIRELKGEFFGSWCLEAASFMGAPELLPLLLDLRKRLDDDCIETFAGQFDEAIEACSR